jgi:hypothetical protein
MDRRHRSDLAEARLRDEARHASGMLATLADLRSAGSSPLLEAAVEYRRDLCFLDILGLIAAFDYDPAALARAAQAKRVGDPEWRTRALAALETTLSAPHLEILKLLSLRAAVADNATDHRPREERLVELGMGRYEWASPWVRACALHALDPSSPAAVEVLVRASADTDPLVAETAAVVLAASRQGEGGSGSTGRPVYATIDKVVLLKEVSIFGAIAHEELAGVASLLAEQWAAPGDRIVERGEVGDCLFVIASGQVRVHDGERTLANLGKNHFFGELSLLDAEPRAASVTAVSETRLFRLGQDDFYALIADRPQMVHAINRGLCRMVRGMR